MEYKELVNPIIFIGTGRSGTTIISQIITSHPDLAFPSNYTGYFYKYQAVNLIRRLFDNKMWRIIGQRKQLNKVSIFNKFIFRQEEAYPMWDYITDEDFSRDFFVNHEPTPSRVEFIRSYFATMVKYQGKKRLVFKITGPSRLKYLLKIFPDALIVNLKRNMIPTTSSFVKAEFWQEKGCVQLWWKGAYNEAEKEFAQSCVGKPALLTALQLNKVVEVTQKELKELNPKFMEVTYEEFVANPMKITKKLVNFLELNHRSNELFQYLESLNIFNRNKKDEEYFANEQLREIYSVLSST